MAVLNFVGAGGHHVGGGHNGTDQNDIITSTAIGDGQIHVWGNAGNDLINLNFDVYGQDTFNPARPRAWWFGGHHVYGGGASGSAGSDVINFTNVENVIGVTVGRIEDFDASRDSIQISGQTLALRNGAGTVGGVQWKVVQWDTDRNDSALGTQPWLVINTNGGVVFYALEGARIVPTGEGGSNNFEQERHFIYFDDLPSNETGVPSESAILALASVQYIDPVNFVPATDPSGRSYQVQPGGRVVNDEDQTRQNLLDVLFGSEFGDLIAAGLNNDTVDARGGNDTVWGGSGDDSVAGSDGDDVLYGNIGNDVLLGGAGNDIIFGGHGSDSLEGASGADVFSFSSDSGADVIADFSLSQGDRIFYNEQNVDLAKPSFQTVFENGDMRIQFSSSTSVLVKSFEQPANFIDATNRTGRIDGTSGSDNIVGGAGQDVFRGGEGRDIFVFVQDDVLDRITDFSPSIDKIDLTSWGVTSFAQISFAVQYKNGEWAGRSNLYFQNEVIRLDGFDLQRLALITTDDFIF